MKHIIVVFLSIFWFQLNAQKLQSNRTLIEAAEKQIAPYLAQFEGCLIDTSSEICVEKLKSVCQGNYQKYLVAGALFNIDQAQSFSLHQEVYKSDSKDRDFTLEYALELHRSGRYKEAIPLYEANGKAVPNDFRIHIWLADCYTNLDNLDKALKCWKLADHAKNHTSIDYAIHVIYGNTEQIKERAQLLKSIRYGDSLAAYSLIFRDFNWELDWWNKVVNEAFVSHDLLLIRNTFGATSRVYQVAATYTDIQLLSTSEHFQDSVAMILNHNKLLIGDYPLCINGDLTSDLLRICFKNKILDEQSFYSKRGVELLALAKANRDKELLNIYAYLQVKVLGKVDPEIDLLGWKSFQDERFAVSYFYGKRKTLTFNDSELEEAIKQFPNSCELYLFKIECAANEKKVLKPYVNEVIRREFKKLDSDPNHFSYKLKLYFDLYENEQ